MVIRDEQEVRDRQARRYDRPLGVWAEVERAAFGVAVGSNGYTVVAEAEELVRRAASAVAGPVLDVGTGRGWPGRLVVETRAVTLIATDVPVNGLRLARSAFDSSQVGAAAHVAAADASALPFQDASFSAVIHADVFC